MELHDIYIHARANFEAEKRSGKRSGKGAERVPFHSPAHTAAALVPGRASHRRSVCIVLADKIAAKYFSTRAFSSGDYITVIVCMRGARAPAPKTISFVRLRVLTLRALPLARGAATRSPSLFFFSLRAAFAVCSRTVFTVFLRRIFLFSLPIYERLFSVLTRSPLPPRRVALHIHSSRPHSDKYYQQFEEQKYLLSHSNDALSVLSISRFRSFPFSSILASASALAVTH